MAEKQRIIIVGGVAGGASAAARARRLSEDAKIDMFERGEYISFANCGLPYHIGETIKDRDRLLVQTPEGMKKRFNIDVHTRTEVVRIDRDRKEVIARNLLTGQEQVVVYDYLVLSPGAAPVKPPIPGIDSPGTFTLRNMADMDAIKTHVDQKPNDQALIIGGGYIGLEMAEALRNRNWQVVLVELASQVFGPIDPEMATPIHQQLKLHGVDVRLGASVNGISHEGDKLHVQLSTGQTVNCGLVLLAIGVKPEVNLAREAGLAIGPRGGIAVDEHMRTSDPAILAVGDVVEFEHFVDSQTALIPLAGPANRQGRIAADNIFGRTSVYRKTQGTAICKIFDLTVGMTGLSEKVMKKMNKEYEKIYIHPASHAGYYPGATPMTLKLLFSPTDGKILGAQAVGGEGVDKRIDVLAVAMRAGLTVRDLKDLELSYAPPYGSAKDPVNYAGFVATNVLDGDVKICHVETVMNLRENQLLLDTRTPAEIQAGTIPGSVNIPVDDLRSRMNELPKDKEIIAFCQVGLRGYLACRILSQHGYNCKNLSGGYKMYQQFMGIGSELQAGSTNKEESKANVIATNKNKSQPIVKHIDVRGLQCPGPIMRLSRELETLQDGQAITITSSDPGFAADVPAWCHSTGHQLAELIPVDGCFKATIVKGQKSTCPVTHEPSTGKKQKTIVVFSNDLDRVMAAFIIANGAATMGSKVTLFFTFWGLNVLRKPEQIPVQKTLVERMFGWMMPCGAENLSLSKMNMAGLGTLMMKGVMRKKNAPMLPDLIEKAKKAGVRMVACAMSMDIMGIKREELIDGVEEGGVAMYLDQAENGNVNLFI